MTTSATDRRPGVEPSEFRDIVGRFASGVTVITTHHFGERRGTTASAFTSLSLEPPMVIVCLNKASATGRAVAETRRFAVNILGEDQVNEAMAFAGRAPDKFAGVAVREAEHGIPVLSGALATLECDVAELATGGTHYVFFGTVERACAGAGAPLAYFRGKFGRLELTQDEGAVAALRARVVSRDIAVGTPLQLDDLAEQIGSLRGPVYHALSRLTGEGLVTRNADGAFVVAPLTLEGVRDAWRTRCAIELGAAALTVGRLSVAALADLSERAAAADPPPEPGFTLDAWLPAYGAFHERIVELAGSSSLLDAYRRIDAPAAILSVTRREMESRGLDREQCVTAHRHMLELVAAYRAGDLTAATAAITRHDRFSEEVAVRFMDRQGGSI